MEHSQDDMTTQDATQMEWSLDYCPACNRSHRITVTIEEKPFYMIEPLSAFVLLAMAAIARIFRGESLTKAREDDGPWTQATFLCENAGEEVRVQVRLRGGQIEDLKISR
jgi:hypothetical protein